MLLLPTFETARSMFPFPWKSPQTRSRGFFPAAIAVGEAKLSARAATELGWTASTNFADGVRRYVDWLSIADRLPVSAAPG